VLPLRAVLFAGALLAALPLQSATILVLRFHNNSQYPDLDWVGESVSETLDSEFAQANQIVLDRDSRTEGMKRLSLRPDADFTKATIIRLAESLDADFAIFGSYEVSLPAGDSELKDSSVDVTAHFIDLRKLKNGPDISEAGKLADLARFKEHLAWESLKYIDPSTTLALDQFMAPAKLTRVDAEESYIRGLLSSDKEHEQKWFLQAVALDPQFMSPAYELGKLYLERKDYRQALHWLTRIPVSDPRYSEARFRMGLSAYGAADYNSAANYFHEVAKLIPLNEVYNDLGAAEDRLNQPAALDDFRRALDGDQNDPVYLFNLGAALLRNNSFDEAARRLEAVTDHSPDDSAAADLLARARSRENNPPGGPPLAPPRLKSHLDATAFRQLKVMLQHKGGG
jgi:tetratricopeptide (TPR) repeat protein